jgi:hypothetical protein
MIKYTFFLKTKDSYEEYQYVLNLNSQQENKPENVFTSEIRESMRNNLQKQSSCKISDSHLNQIIKTWLQDIKEGYRDSRMTLDLTLLIVENISSLQEQGYHEIPGLIPPNLSNIEPCFGMLPPLIFS